MDSVCVSVCVLRGELGEDAEAGKRREGKRVAGQLGGEMDTGRGGWTGKNEEPGQ